MIQDYITTNLSKASYEMIDDGQKFYAEVKGLRGVWAIGRTLEECRNNLMSTIEGWLIVRLKKGLPIPHFKIPSGHISVKKYA